MGKVKIKEMNFFFKFFMQMYLTFTRNSDAVLQRNVDKNENCNLGFSGEIMSLKFDL